MCRVHVNVQSTLVEKCSMLWGVVSRHGALQETRVEGGSSPVRNRKSCFAFLYLDKALPH
jgi:hypothetical protein